ncbi:hypothetical protein GN956_G6251 [Arapaima gigas]
MDSMREGVIRGSGPANVQQRFGQSVGGIVICVLRPHVHSPAGSVVFVSVQPRAKRFWQKRPQKSLSLKFYK